MTGRYLEDYAIGQDYKSPRRLKVEAEAIKRFATEFDPQPFHLDEEKAKGTFFGGLDLQPPGRLVDLSDGIVLEITSGHRWFL